MPALSIAALANIMDLFMGPPFWRAGQVYFAKRRKHFFGKIVPFSSFNFE